MRFMVRSGAVSFALSMIILLCAPLGLAQEPPAKEPPSPGSTHKVKRGPFRVEVQLTGVFEADRMWPVMLSPKDWSSFTVVDAARHGQEVKKGDTLVSLDMTEIDQRLEDLDYEMRIATLSQQLLDLDLELLKLTTPMDQESAERVFRIAAEDFRYFTETDRQQQAKMAEYSLKSARESLEYAQEELDQLEKMYKADDLTEETEEIILKRAQRDVERARFFLESTELRVKRSLDTELPRQEEQLRDGARRAEIALNKAKASLPNQLKKQEIEREKQVIANQRSAKKRDELNHDREIMAVKSPADGRVYYGQCRRGKWSGVDAVLSQLEPGGKLSPQNVFMTVVALRPLHIRADVPEKELHLIQKGIKGMAVPAGFPGIELPAAVLAVSPLPLATGTFDGVFQVTLGNDAQPVVPGMECKMTFVAYEKSDALTVPASAVFKDESTGRQNLVYVANADGTSAKRQVVVGQKTEQKWEILDGLAAGDQILLKEPDAE